MILPVYNHATMLVRALTALVEQTVPPHEVIIIDDASTDTSLAVATDFRARMEAVCQYRVLRNEMNLGVNRTLNRGLDLAVGTHVICTAADDWLLPRCIEEFQTAARTFPDARLITSRYVEYFEKADTYIEHDINSELGLWYARAPLSFFSVDEFSDLLTRGYVALPVSASLLEVTALREVGAFDPALKWHADWFAAYAIALRWGFGLTSESLAVFRVANGTYSGDNVRRRFVRRADQQRTVCEALRLKLRQRNFEDIRQHLARTPAAFAPFVRYVIATYARHPSEWPLLARIVFWWLNEARRGRRPGPLRHIAKSLGVRTAPR